MPKKLFEFGGRNGGMAFPKKRALPKKSEAATLEALEKREDQVRQVGEFLDGKRALESLGLSLEHLKAFAALREGLGPDGLRRLAPLLRSADPREVPALLALGLTADEAAALRKIYQALKSAGLSAEDAATHLEAAAELARLGFGTAAVKGVAREVGRLRKAGVPPERVASILAAYAEHQGGAEGALVDAVRRQKEAEAALVGLEKKTQERSREAESLEGSAGEVHQALMNLRREVMALRQQKDFLDAEVKGLGRARGAPWVEVVGRVRAGFEHLRKEHEKGREALEELRKEMEKLQKEKAQSAAKSPDATSSPEPAVGQPAAAGARYSRLMQKLQQVAISPAPAPGAPPEPPAGAPFDPLLVEAAFREVIEGLASLKADADTMARKQEALEAEVRKRESELQGAATLWTLLAGQSDVDLRTAAESLAQAAREGKGAPVPPEFAERLRESARRLLQAEMVPMERLRAAEREVEEVRRRLEASVPRVRFDALVKEAEDLQKRLAEAAPKWQVEAQEHELRFLKKMAFEKRT